MTLSALREKRIAFYKSIVAIDCPILKESVFFTSNGFNHLLYESNRLPRKQSEQFMKLKCLEHAPVVIKNCKVISEIRERDIVIKGITKKAIHYELIHEVEQGKKIRVIIQRIGTGKLTFLSVMRHRKASRTKKRPS